MRIGIDARLLHRRGIGRYTQELVRNLSGIDKENEYVVYRSRVGAGMLEYPDSGQFREKELGGRDFSLSQFKMMRTLVASDGIDLFHSPFDPMISFIPAPKKLLTVHGPSFGSHIGVFTNSKTRVLLQGYIFRRALSTSQAIIASCDTYRRRLLKTYSWLDKDKVHLVHQGVGDEFRPIFEHGERKRVKEKYGIFKNYFFSVGSFSHHKESMMMMLRVYSELPEEIRMEYNLVVAGEYPKSTLLRAVEEFGIQKQVKFLGFVSVNDVPVLYNSAKIFLFFSPYDGFENPPLEAMASGTPVVTSSTLDISERLGNIALRVKPTDMNEIISVISRLISDNAEYIMVRQFGVERAKSFRWHDTARKVLDVYNML